MVSRETLREALILTWPLLPAWFIGAFRLTFTEGMWDPVMGNPLNVSEENTLGAQMLLILVLGSVFHLLAPRLGPYLTAVTPSSSSRPVLGYGSMTGNIGTSIIRILALFTIYLMVFAKP